MVVSDLCLFFVVPWVGLQSVLVAFPENTPCRTTEKRKIPLFFKFTPLGAQWLSGRVLDSRPGGRRFEPLQRHCVVVLEQGTFILAKYWFNPERPIPV